MEKFDVVIIGAGPAGLGLAYDLKQAGQAVAVVEENRWGGTCPNRGCDPKKVLMAAVEAKLRSHHLVGKGLENEPEIDWPSLMRFKETFTEPVSSSSRQGLVDAGITVLDGHAEFVDQHTLKVGEQRVESSQFVIATGQRPGRLSKIENEALMQTSTDFLAMPELPKRIALVGGGYIAFELAAIA
ncbi:FAD-dependent oxidoreductase, partial [Pediococcus acidilactici]|nr:FAD-dependent oxidoreductase [Pediococcus acidilactici]